MFGSIPNVSVRLIWKILIASVAGLVPAQPHIAHAGCAPHFQVNEHRTIIISDQTRNGESDAQADGVKLSFPKEYLLSPGPGRPLPIFHRRAAIFLLNRITGHPVDRNTNAIKLTTTIRFLVKNEKILLPTLTTLFAVTTDRRNNDVSEEDIYPFLTPAPHGLRKISGMLQKFEEEQNFFVAITDDRISDVITCWEKDAVVNALCIHTFDYGSLGVRATFFASTLHDWRKSKEHMFMFLECAAIK